MSEQTTEDAEREEIEMLLPWYVTGRLDHADRARVERYLDRHPHVAAQLDLVRTEQEQSVALNEALGAPSPGAVDRLMAALPPVRPSLWQRIQASPAYQAVEEFFAAPTARSVRWGAVAAAAVVVVQAAVITTFIIRGGSTYQTASGQGTEEGVPALVVFADDAKASAIADLLREFDASIVDGPKPGGVYKIRLRSADRSQAAQDDLLRQLAERRDIVKAVLPSKD